ncbi:type II CAAX endopeptidase family protein [uncultured Kushneria sp.]|uniref:CPBP family intramembrane glutamic endopeptidase n=1 Tax=uncultured Kushneria sp. TaxID=905033 RepID=UPI002611BD15|nr:type II CAAX endopeptidase family protein [uncultured Kushneria sp.]
MTTARPFCQRASLQVLFGLLMFAVYLGSQFLSVWVLQHVMSAAAFAALIQGYGFAVLLAPSLVLMLAGFWAWRRWFSPQPTLAGHFTKGDFARGIGLVLLVQGLAAAISVWLNMAPEAFMTSLYDGKSLLQSLIMAFCVLVWAPIIEELAFRHFLMSRIDDQSSGLRGAFLIIFSALCFAGLHMFQYHHVITFLALLGWGLVLGCYRWRTRGLLLPMLLHAVISSIGLVGALF